MNLSLHRPLAEGKGFVTQWFGETAIDYSRFGLAGHNGLDYGASPGTPVRAAHRGLVTIGDDPAGYGLFVRIMGEHCTTIYAHLGVICVTERQLVEPLEVIGEVGSTGNSTGPHLHFGVRVVGMDNPAYLDYVDPAVFRDI